MQEKFVLLQNKYELEVLFGAFRNMFTSAHSVSMFPQVWLVPSILQYLLCITVFTHITWIPWQFTHFVPMLPCIYFSGFQYLAVFLAEMLVNEGICTKWRNFRSGMIKLESIEINGNIAQNVFINFCCETTWDKNSETAHTRRHWCFCGTPPLLGSILRLSWKYCFSSDKYPWCLFNLETSIWFNCGTY